MMVPTSLMPKLIFSLVVFLTFGTNTGGEISIGQDAADTDEYTVYTALYREKGNDNPKVQMVIEEKTQVRDLFSESLDAQKRGQLVESLTRQLPPLTKETAEDFLARNTKSSLLTNRFILKANVILVSKDELNRIFSGSIESSWQRFNEKYPKAGGVDTLSRVGFNKDKTQ